MTFEPNLLRGKTAIVTGGTTGIGAGIVEALSGLGARVVAVGIGAAAYRAPAGADVVARELDVTDDAGVAALVDSCERIDIVVNCAGIIRRVEEHQLDVFERVLAVNLTGTMRVCTAARSKLAASSGCIVNTASMLSFFGGSLVPAYSASKGGVAQLTKSLALAYAPDGIRVNAVAPGWIATPLTQALQDDPARSQPILSRTPLGRWGTPHDVAQAVSFLVSPAASFMTGVILPVDGGYLIA
ncbi:SDR family NAD(P)-dependent oxidoreductase [Methylobacterium nodulans]|uniref:Short-chain dehydrogenase/reductase SDR n=1 Tax=Methylobacterium nodulans (strain LMG 21967 / CNCM I-2342 / ORS 2060) TaxID=460265 RepID=B8IFD8_METNO|nr:SDR family oxidoreductase [Methylobacterium nodulans]ACL57673.1 short-chain dehydrogenase/reductase SDR [Methylobacterium nodulans ORS 2060]